MIKKRKIFTTMALLCSIIIAGCTETKQISGNDVPNKVEEKQDPNILLIVADDMGYSDLSAFGSEINTPNLDAIVKDGMQFTNFHVAGTCSPTRSMLLTGVDNHLNGMGNMIEIMADNQFDQPGYEGGLNDNVVTVASLLQDDGYNTYMAGKWHLGKAAQPVDRGFTRSVALMESGADNWEEKPYLPSYSEVHYYEDGKRISLPENFYSSRYYSDKLIEYIDEGQVSNKPFLGYLAFQAVHYPHQAPKEYTEKYMKYYENGWEELRKERFDRMVKLGIISADVKLPDLPNLPKWDTLSDKEKKYQAKKMAVYAGMVEYMDESIGKVVDHLKEIGEYDNTVIIFLSDNGTDMVEQDVIFPEYYKKNFDMSYEKLGEKGSYSNYGPGWAAAAMTPFTNFKGTSYEGGMRSPFIVSYPGVIDGNSKTDVFAYVKDITPTLLELASIEQPDGEYKGKKVEKITGKSMLDFFKGKEKEIYSDQEGIGYELAGGYAIFKGDYKIVRNVPPFVSDRTWHLYNYKEDPTESNDLRETMPDKFKELLAEYDRYAEKNKLIEVPDDYNTIEQLDKNVIRFEKERAEKEKK